MSASLKKWSWNRSKKNSAFDFPSTCAISKRSVCSAPENPLMKSSMFIQPPTQVPRSRMLLPRASTIWLAFTLRKSICPAPVASVDSLLGRRIEQMRVFALCGDADGFAGPGGDALAEDCADRLSADLRHHLRFGAGRLDHLHRDRKARVVEHEVLGPDAIDRRQSRRRCRRICKGQREATRSIDHEAFALDLPLEQVHRGAADEAGNEEVGRTVVEVEWGADLLD